MKPADLLAPMDAPALYFMQQTATLREKVDALTLALLKAQEMIEDPNADHEDADRVNAIITQTLKATQ